MQASNLFSNGMKAITQILTFSLMVKILASIGEDDF